ncbi:Hypothetical predicted protein [Olea europaea subsp. europaea]|uniref:Uncharacterized protein n=1 Tax=Olea europaea subsp. europaea TaxID=158383 RepID=A0A8S0Q5X5_OLEEU|nr:Hypothetical predicted protein [Olea europaea subsp. europaea]
MPCNAAPSVLQLKNQFESMSSSSQQRHRDKAPPPKAAPPTYDKVAQLIDLSDTVPGRSSEVGVLRVYDRVVWVGDDGPISGTIINIQPATDEVILELDEPIRSKVKPFRLEKNMIVPTMELLKYDDYYDSKPFPHGVQMPTRKNSDNNNSPCEKSCQASNENLLNSQLLERLHSNDLPSKKASLSDLPPRKTIPNDLPPRKATSNELPPRKATFNDLPPRKATSNDLPPRKATSNDLPPRKPTSSVYAGATAPPRDFFLSACTSQDLCDYQDPASPVKISPNLSSSPNLEGKTKKQRSFFIIRNTTASNLSL